MIWCYINETVYPFKVIHLLKINYKSPPTVIRVSHCHKSTAPAFWWYTWAEKLLCPLNFEFWRKAPITSAASSLIGKVFTVFPRVHCCLISGSDSAQLCAICLYCSEATGNGGPVCMCVCVRDFREFVVFLNEALSACLCFSSVF